MTASSKIDDRLNFNHEIKFARRSRALESHNDTSIVSITGMCIELLVKIMLFFPSVSFFPSLSLPQSLAGSLFQANETQTKDRTEHRNVWLLISLERLKKASGKPRRSIFYFLAHSVSLSLALALARISNHVGAFSRVSKENFFPFSLMQICLHHQRTRERKRTSITLITLTHGS